MPSALRAAAEDSDMSVIFHGVRGTAPVSGAAFADYGGDTPSIEVRAANRRVFLDAGTGLRNAGPTDDDGGEFDIILSHYHADHLVGLASFAPFWVPGGRLRIWAPRFSGVDPISAVRSFFSPPYSPIALEDSPMTVEIRAFTPGDVWRIERALEISTSLQNHPGGSCSIAVRSGDVRAVYASDIELDSDAEIGRLSDFALRADLLIVDAMWTPQEAELRRGWGHSSFRQSIVAAERAEAGRTALFHHDPGRTDLALLLLDGEAAHLRESAFFARQGMTIDLNSATLDVTASIANRKETASWRCSRSDTFWRSPKR